jgi:hypothetical protein
MRRVLATQATQEGVDPTPRLKSEAEAHVVYEDLGMSSAIESAGFAWSSYPGPRRRKKRDPAEPQPPPPREAGIPSSSYAARKEREAGIPSSSYAARRARKEGEQPPPKGGKREPAPLEGGRPSPAAPHVMSPPRDYSGKLPEAQEGREAANPEKIAKALVHRIRSLADVEALNEGDLKYLLEDRSRLGIVALAYALDPEAQEVPRERVFLGAALSAEGRDLAGRLDIDGARLIRGPRGPLLMLRRPPRGVTVLVANGGQDPALYSIMGKTVPERAAYRACQAGRDPGPAPFLYPGMWRSHDGKATVHRSIFMNPNYVGAWDDYLAAAREHGPPLINPEKVEFESGADAATAEAGGFRAAALPELASPAWKDAQKWAGEPDFWAEEFGRAYPDARAKFIGARNADKAAAGPIALFTHTFVWPRGAAPTGPLGVTQATA